MNSKRLISTFCELVKIPSESPNDREFISYVEKYLKIEGAKSQLDSYGNLIVKFPALNSNSKRSVAFCCHADTVKPGIGIVPVIKDGIIRSKGNTILGADDKAGIAEFIELIRACEKRPPVEFILTRCEEIGSLGARNLDYSLVDSKIAYVMDMDAPSEVVIGEATHIHMDVTYKGKAAHSGVEPEKGVSSVLGAVDALYNMKLGRIDEESTSNVGVFSGGEARNIIPEETKLEAECRSLSHEKALIIAKEMETQFINSANKTGTKVDIDTNIVSKGYLIDAGEEIVKRFTKALLKHNVEPDVKVITAGTDASCFNEHGIKSLVVGIGCRDIHSKEEYAIISEMETITKVLISLLEDMAENE